MSNKKKSWAVLAVSLFFAIAICAGMFLFMGCTPSVPPVTEQSPSNYLNPQCVVAVEGGEYFKVSAYGSYNYVHKGNCKNPIHSENAKLVEMVPEATKVTN